jgi:hypothetical protein
MNDYKFTEDEIPYQTLEKFGLTKEMITDLPTAVLEQISYGRRSPVLPIQIKDEEGNTIKSHTRIRLVRVGNDLDVVFYPKLQENSLARFNDEQKQRLLGGKAIIGTMTTDDGKEVQAFHQLDHETNQILSVPTQVIGSNLQIAAKTFNISNAEFAILRNGDTLSFVDEDNDLISLGIDLNDSTGLRLCLGDSEKWIENRKMAWDKYNFGVFGCWTCDDNGNVDYIKEENYSEEMWDELKKNSARKAHVTPKM